MLRTIRMQMIQFGLEPGYRMKGLNDFPNLLR